MTINVSGPNGVNVSFPDGTDAATINSVMAQHFGGSVPKAPAPGRPWEAYGHVSGPWDEWRSDPVAPKSSGEFWKDDPVVAPQSHPAPPPGFVLDSAASGVPPLPSGFVLDPPSVGGRPSASPPSQLVPVDHDPWAEFRTADQPSVGGRPSATKTGVTLNIGGQTVTVDESFLKLSPDQQNATVDEIVRSLRAKAQRDWDVVSQKPIGPWDVVAQSPISEQPSVASDMAKSIPGDIVGAVHDVAGLPGYMMSMADTAGDWLNKKYAQAGFDVKPNRTSHIAPTSEELTTNLENNLTGPLYQPQTVPGQHLRTAIGFAPQALGAAETGGAAAVPALVKIGKKLIFSPRVWGSWAPGMLQAAMRPDRGRLMPMTAPPPVLVSGDAPALRSTAAPTPGPRASGQPVSTLRDR